MIIAARQGPCDVSEERLLRVIRNCRDAAYFVKLCYHQKVHALALNALRPMLERHPSEFLQSCVGSLYGKWRLRTVPLLKRIRQTIATTQAALDAACVPYCFMRGIPFANQYYAHPELRICSDVDLLVPREFRQKAVATLFDVGFKIHGTRALQEARNEFEGQAELICPEHSILVDVNWMLTGNVSIGQIQSDVDLIWDRARHVANAEYRMSHEDAFLDLVRHVGHGHDFEHGFVLACADVEAILSSCRELDWPYVCEQARKSESLRILTFFAFFFDNYYRNASARPLADCLAMRTQPASPIESALFARLIQVPLVRRKTRFKTTTEIISGNTAIAGKIWAIDRFSRLVRVLLTLPWPSKHEVVMLTLESPSESIAWRRFRYYFNPLLFVLPGIVFGAAARMAGACFPRMTTIQRLLRRRAGVHRK
jgi:hypothetical protein